jgi:hypothetical protein
MSDRSDDPRARFIKDATRIFDGGVDGGRPPSEIGLDQVAAAVNCTLRGGRARPRPGWFNRPLVFDSESIQELFLGSDTANAGFFQEAGFYNGGGYAGANALTPQPVSLLTSISGRQLRISLLPQMGTTTTTAEVVLPAVGSTVPVPVLTSFQMSMSQSAITIDGYPVTLTYIDPGGTSITVQNNSAPGVGIILLAGSTVAFPPVQAFMVDEITPSVGTLLGTIQTAGGSTTSSMSFIIPNSPGTSTVNVVSSSGFSLAYPNLTVGGYPVLLTAINSNGTQMTVQNNTPANNGITVASGLPVVQAFVIPAVGTPANLPVTDTTDFTPQYPLITLGGNTLNTSVNTTNSPAFAVPPLNQSITIPVNSTTGMTKSLPLIGIRSSTAITSDVTFPGPVTTTGPNSPDDKFNIPSAGSTVSVFVADSSGLSMLYPALLIGGYRLTLTKIISGTKITVLNELSSQAGEDVDDGAAVAVISAPFTIPVTSTQGMSLEMPGLAIQSVPNVQLTLLSLNQGANAITVQNNDSDYSGVTFHTPITLLFDIPLNLTLVDQEYNTIEVQNQIVANGGMAIASAAPVDFQTTATATTTTTNTDNIPIPAVGCQFPVPVTSTVNFPFMLVNETIHIGGYLFAFVSVDGPLQITVNNMTSGQGGKNILPASNVSFPQAGLTNISIVKGYAMPAVGSNIAVALASTAGISISQPNLIISGYAVTLISVDTPTQITVQNRNAEYVGAWIANGSSVQFTQVNYTLIVTDIVNSTTVQVENNLTAQAGASVPAGTNVQVQVADTNDPLVPMNWSRQAERWWILQDNQSLPVIYDGSMAVRSDPSKNQVPVGNVMCYAQGRLSVALTDRLSYMVGDAVGDPSGTPGNNYLDSILFFTDTQYLNEGGNLVARIYGAPSNGGPILSMVACAQTDTQLGQGSMLVGTPNVVFTVNLPFDRTTWSTTTNPLQTANPIIGPVGQRSTVLVNTDCWYRSMDGMRSYKMAWREINTGPGNTSLSNEVDDILEKDTQFLMEFESAVLFDKRLLTTIGPVMSAQGVWHQGLAVVDFNIEDGLRRRSKPAWEGTWSGLRILKILTGKVNNTDRAFMFVLNDEAQIELWELSTDNEYDGDWNGSLPPTPINWTVESRGYTCRNPDQFKKLKHAHIVAPVVSGAVTFAVAYKSDEWPCWQPWKTVVRCAKTGDCGTWVNPGCIPAINLPQPRRPIRLPEPADTPNDITKKLYRNGYEFQLQLQIQGYAEISELRLFAMDEPELVGPDRASEYES